MQEEQVAAHLVGVRVRVEVRVRPRARARARVRVRVSGAVTQINLAEVTTPAAIAVDVGAVVGSVG